MKFTLPLDIVELEPGNFHLFVDVNISGVPCRLLVDTGASKTVLDAERVLRFVKASKIQSHESKSIGLGVTDMETRVVTLKNIAMKKFTRKKMEVAILPLGHVNSTYTILNVPVIDGVLGSDFLVKYNAVIDMGKSKLILRK